MPRNGRAGRVCAVALHNVQAVRKPSELQTVLSAPGWGGWGLLPTVSQRALELEVCTSTAAPHTASIMLYNLSTVAPEYKTFYG